MERPVRVHVQPFIHYGRLLRVDFVMDGTDLPAGFEALFDMVESGQELLEEVPQCRPPDHIAVLLLESRPAGGLERLDPVRLEALALQNVVDGGGHDPLRRLERCTVGFDIPDLRKSATKPQPSPTWRMISARQTCSVSICRLALKRSRHDWSSSNNEIGGLLPLCIMLRFHSCKAEANQSRTEGPFAPVDLDNSLGRSWIEAMAKKTGIARWTVVCGIREPEGKVESALAGRASNLGV